jgi:hypothetical protein
VGKSWKKCKVTAGLESSECKAELQHSTLVQRVRTFRNEVLFKKVGTLISQQLKGLECTPDFAMPN